jgi:hypothetical protein
MSTKTWAGLLVLIAVVGVILVGSSNEYPTTWWFATKVRELADKIGEAFIVAVVSAILVDRYVRSRLAEEVARDVIPFGIGLGLPVEFPKELRSLFRAGVTRRNVQATYRLERVPGYPYVKNTGSMSFLLENNTSVTQHFVHAVHLAESPFCRQGGPDAAIRRISCWTGQKYDYDLAAGAPGFDANKANGVWKISREVRVPTGATTIKCESEWTEYYWENYADHFTFGAPTVGIAFEIHFPHEEIEIISVAFQKDVDSDQIKLDNPRPGLKTWTYPGVMLTGQHLWIQWQRKTATTLTQEKSG